MRPWHVDDGLPDNNVTGIVQTGEGYLWIATQAGLARFDGMRFVQQPLPVGAGISNSLVRVLALGKDNTLWVALEAEGGLVAGFSEQGREVYTAAEGVPSFKPLVMVQTSDGASWAAYVDGTVCRFSRGVVDRFGPRDGLTGTTGCWLATDVAGHLWFAKAGRVGVFSDGKFEALHAFQDRVIRITRSRTGGVWVLAGRQLWKCGKGKEPVAMGDIPTDRPGVEPTFVYEDRMDGVWLGTKAGGLYYANHDAVMPVETSHSDITTVMEDREGNIWVGTEGGGLNRLRHRILELYGSASGVPFETARSVCVDDAGTVWAAGVNGALARRISGEWSQVSSNSGWPGVRATCVANDGAGGVWVGTYRGGLWRWQDGRFTELDAPLGGEVVRGLFLDSRKNLWIAMEATNCLQRLQNGRVQTYPQPVGTRTIRAIAEDASGRIWLGTSDGFLLRVQGDTLVDETGHTLKTPKPIRSLHTTADGSLWIGYAAAGLGWLKEGVFHRFGMEHGLLDNYICGIESDSGGALWLASGRGLFQVRQREFELIAEGTNNRLLAVDFGRNEGLPNLQGIYGYWPTIGRERNGRLWLGTRSGLVVARPDRVQLDRIPPSVLIERMVVDGQPHALPAGGRKLMLLPGHRKLEFEFTAINFGAPENIRLQYRLEGWDDEWSEPAQLRSATFQRLQPGQYRFQVMARNAGGVWNREGEQIVFEVEPFLWQRWWFRLLAVTAFTGIIIAIVRYVSFRRLRTRVQRLEQEAGLARDRARIAQDLHDDLGANLTQIALLSELAQNDFEKPAEARGHIDQIFRTAKSLTRSLDEIVWAVNPKNDLLDRFVAHLCTYAPDYLRSAGVRCRLDVPVEVPSVVLPSDVRHHVHLAVKEALHNVAKHAGAREVRLQLQLGEEELTVIIEDDGSGLEAGQGVAGQDGLSNLDWRMREVGGRFESSSAPGRGTTIRLSVPLSTKRG